MANKAVRTQVIILFLLILANFIAQIPYYFHLYYNPQNPFAQARSMLVMGVVFAWFLLASYLLFTRKTSGYWLMLSFVAVEFLFYLYNTIGEVVHGFGLFFHLYTSDVLLRIVFAIGYINLFAAGYFLLLLLLKRSSFLDSRRERGSYKVGEIQ